MLSPLSFTTLGVKPILATIGPHSSSTAVLAFVPSYTPYYADLTEAQVDLQRWTNGNPSSLENDRLTYAFDFGPATADELVLLGHVWANNSLQLSADDRAAARRIVISNLLADHTYRFTISLANVGGFGPSSQWSGTISTTGATVPGPPSNVRKASISSWKVDAQWTPPLDTGGSIITQIELCAALPTGQPPDCEASVHSSSAEALEGAKLALPGLRASTSYDLYARVANALGWSVWSSPPLTIVSNSCHVVSSGSHSSPCSQTTSAPTAPAPPEAISCTFSQGGNVAIDTTPSPNTGGLEISIAVTATYEEGGYAEDLDRGTYAPRSATEALFPGQTSGFVSFLLANATYLFKARTYNSVGSSSWTSFGKSCFSGSGMSPLPPAITSVQPTGGNAVVAWEPPPDIGGAVLSYFLLSVSTTNDAPILSWSPQDRPASQSPAWIEEDLRAWIEEQNATVATYDDGTPTEMIGRWGSSNRLGWTSAVYLVTPGTRFTAEDLLANTQYHFVSASISRIGLGFPLEYPNFIVTSDASQPSAPTSVRAKTRNAGSLVLSWLPPRSLGGALLRDYFVYLSLTSSDWTTVKVVNGTNYEVEIGALAASSSYFFRVQARSQPGFFGPTSTSSSALTTRAPTSPGPAPAPSVDLEGRNVKVAWERPLDSGGLPLTGVTAEFRRALSSKWTRWAEVIPLVDEFEGTGLPNQLGLRNGSLVIPGLFASTEYSFRVIFRNDVGLGTSSYPSPSLLTSAATLPKAPPSSPVPLHSGSSQVLLQWKIPFDLGGRSIDAFIISMIAGSDPDTTVKEIVVPASSVTIIPRGGAGELPGLEPAAVLTGDSLPIARYLVSGLLANNNYRAAVSIRTAEGSSSSTPPSRSIYTKGSTAPASPESVFVINETTGGFALCWQPPLDDGGTSITGYDRLVYLVNQGVTSSIILPRIDAGNTDIAGLCCNALPEQCHTSTGPWYYDQVQGLMAGETYAVQVFGKSSAGFGSLSSVSLTSTAQLPHSPVSQAPEVPSVTSFTADAAELEWSRLGLQDVGYDILQWRVLLSLPAEEHWDTVALVTGNSMAATVARLKGGIQYCAAIQYRVSAGWSPRSTSVCFTTMQTSPPKPPTNVKVFPGIEAVIEWNLPSSLGGHPLSDLGIEVLLSGPNPYHRFLPGSATSLIVPLDEGEYTLSLRTRGPANESDSAFVTTFQNTPAAPNSLLDAWVEFNDCSAQLKWMPVAADSQYSVELLQQHSSQHAAVPHWYSTAATYELSSQHFTLNSSTAEFTLFGLLENQTYVVRLRRLTPNESALAETDEFVWTSSSECTVLPPIIETVNLVTSESAHIVVTGPLNSPTSPIKCLGLHLTGNLGSYSPVLDISALDMFRPFEIGNPWTRPHACGNAPPPAVEGGIVLYFPAPRRVLGDAYHVEIHRLLSETQYTIAALAMTETGVWSDPSTVRNFTTLAAAEVSLSLSMRVPHATSESAMVLWEFPAMTGGLEALPATLELLPLPPSDCGAVSITVDAYSQLFRPGGLCPNTVYNVSAATNSSPARRLEASPGQTQFSTNSPSAPSAPTNITVVALGSSSVHLTWSAPELLGGLPIQSYSVFVTLPVASYLGGSAPSTWPAEGICASNPDFPLEFFPTSPSYHFDSKEIMGTNWISPLNYSGSSTSAVIPYLWENTTYSFLIAATNAMGRGSLSEPANVTTETVEAPGMPTILAVELASNSSSELLVRAQAPATTGGLPLVHIEYRAISSKQNSSGVVQFPSAVVAASEAGLQDCSSDEPVASTEPAFMLTVPSLRALTTYRVSIRVGNGEFMGPWSPFGYATMTGPPSPPGVPPSPLIESASSTGSSLVMTIQPPNDDGGVSISSYEVFVAKRSTSIEDFEYLDTVEVVGASTEAMSMPFTTTIQHLDACTPYFFRVRGVNAAGASASLSEASNVGVTREPFSPTPPRNVSVSIVHGSGELSFENACNVPTDEDFIVINITWEKPEDHGGQPLVGYEIER